MQMQLEKPPNQMEETPRPRGDPSSPESRLGMPVEEMMQMKLEKPTMHSEESPRSDLSSPEARLGMQVEDLWDVQEPQLSPTEKLNACFESIPVSSFPQASSSHVIEIRSDTSLAEAVQILAENRILSAPVVDVDAPEDATWIDRYIGMVEFAGIVVWILHQSELAANGLSADAAGAELMTGRPKEVKGNTIEELGADSARASSATFFETLTSSDFYKSTKVRDISGSFRWAPFLALQKANSFLTMLLLLSKYKMKSVPILDLGDEKIYSIVTQSAVIHMLGECAGLPWFENWGNKNLSELGLPLMPPNRIVMVSEDEPVLHAFKLMRKKRVGGVPVVKNGGRQAIGNISIRDVQFLLTAPEIYHDYRCITAKNFLTAVKGHLKGQREAPSMLTGMITCKKEQSIKEVIRMLDSKQIHRIYVVDDGGSLEGVITLRDIISKLVHEPRGYFGDFFDGVLPLPLNSRV